MAMHISRRHVPALLAGLFGGLAAAGAARAQDAVAETYPSRPVRIIVPFPPGQAADVFARVVADELSKRWPQRVVVENRSGGAGTIGMDAIARAAPDGLTLGIGTPGTMSIGPSVMPRLPYDVERDFAPITNIFIQPLLILVHPSLPVRTIQELVAYVKANPGLEFASAGPATAQHMAAELFAHKAGLRMTHVPYRGSGPAMTDLIAGNINLLFDGAPSAMPHVQAGRARALAVTTENRFPQLPDVPTVSETVIPGYAAAGWSGFVAPAATPTPILRKVSTDVVAVLNDEIVKKKIADLSALPDPQTPEAFTAFIRAERAKWKEVAEIANVRLDN
jgi:tripartite-type tricarboxylate transporter receptor subunit TctC